MEFVSRVYRLTELGQSAGGLDYTVMSKPPGCFAHLLALDVALSEQPGCHRKPKVRRTR